MYLVVPLIVLFLQRVHKNDVKELHCIGPRDIRQNLHHLRLGVIYHSVDELEMDREGSLPDHDDLLKFDVVASLKKLSSLVKILIMEN